MATAPKELKFRDAVANGRSVKDGKRMGCLGFHNFIVGNSPIVGKPSTTGSSSRSRLDANAIING